METNRLCAALVLLLVAGVGQAATEARAQALGKKLTPMGAERGANNDGTIPAWTGGDLKAARNW